MMIYSAVRGLY